MLKRTINYEDFDGNKFSEVFYFNLSKPELIEMEVDVQGGLGNWIAEIIKTEDKKELLNQFKKIVLKAYGVRSDDGKRFIKTDEQAEEFSQTGAYIALYEELAMDENAAADFIRGIMPRDMVDRADASEAEAVKAALLNDPNASPHSS